MYRNVIGPEFFTNKNVRLEKNNNLVKDTVGEIDITYDNLLTLCKKEGAVYISDGAQIYQVNVKNKGQGEEIASTPLLREKSIQTSVNISEENAVKSKNFNLIESYPKDRSTNSTTGNSTVYVNVESNAWSNSSRFDEMLMVMKKELGGKWESALKDPKIMDLANKKGITPEKELIELMLGYTANINENKGDFESWYNPADASKLKGTKDDDGQGYLCCYNDKNAFLDDFRVEKNRSPQILIPLNKDGNIDLEMMTEKVGDLKNNKLTNLEGDSKYIDNLYKDNVEYKNVKIDVKQIEFENEKKLVQVLDGPTDLTNESVKEYLLNNPAGQKYALPSLILNEKQAVTPTVYRLVDKEGATKIVKLETPGDINKLLSENKNLKLTLINGAYAIFDMDKVNLDPASNNYEKKMESFCQTFNVMDIQETKRGTGNPPNIRSGGPPITGIERTIRKPVKSGNGDNSQAGCYTIDELAKKSPASKALLEKAFGVDYDKHKNKRLQSITTGHDEINGFYIAIEFFTNEESMNVSSATNTCVLNDPEAKDFLEKYAFTGEYDQASNSTKLFMPENKEEPFQETPVEKSYLAEIYQDKLTQLFSNEDTSLLRSLSGNKYYHIAQDPVLTADQKQTKFNEEISKDTAEIKKILELIKKNNPELIPSIKTYLHGLLDTYKGSNSQRMHDKPGSDKPVIEIYEKFINSYNNELL